MHVLRNTSMHAHNFLVNKSNKRHVVKAGVKCLPETNFIPSLNFIKEPIDSCDCLAFVIASENDNLLRISNFQGKKEADDFT